MLVGESVTVWRICAYKYAPSAFDGKGAALHPGRWNSRGVKMVYTAESLSLSMLEWLVHALNLQPREPYVYFEVSLPADSILRLSQKDLPADWKSYPHPRSTRRLGNAWIRSRKSIALRVPSVIVPGEHNYLLNPAHPDFGRVKIAEARPLPFDPRLQGPLRRTSKETGPQ